MAGFFEDIGEFFTGDKARKAEGARSALESQQRAYTLEQQQAARRAAAGVNQATQGLTDINRDVAKTEALNAQNAASANKIGATYGNQVASDMGSGAADYMQKADAAASEQAGRAGQASALGAARMAIKAARSAGLNKGQSALTGGQQAGDAYTGAYTGGLESGRQQYGQNIQQRQGLSQDAYGRGERATGMQMQGQGMRSGNVQAAGALQSGLNQTATGAASASANSTAGLNQAGAQNAQQAGAQGGGTLGGITSAIGSLLSDENQKTDVTVSGIRGKINEARSIGRLRKLAEKVEPVDFNYKPESGEDPNARNVGVMAQDIEKTDMADNVTETPAGKVVDVKKQTMANLNYIVEMARAVVQLVDELEQLKAEIAAGKGN